jgi:serine protease DegQ
VAIQDLTPELAQAMNTNQTNGAVIARVEAGSPAEQAGLHTGDLVVAVNGTPVRSGTQLRNAIGLSRIGEQVTLTVDRRGSEYSIPVRIDAATANANTNPNPNANPTRPRSNEPRPTR